MFSYGIRRKIQMIRNKILWVFIISVFIRNRLRRATQLVTHKVNKKLTKTSPKKSSMTEKWYYCHTQFWISFGLEQAFAFWNYKICIKKINRSGHQRCSTKKSVLKNFSRFSRFCVGAYFLIKLQASGANFKRTLFL